MIPNKLYIISLPERQDRRDAIIPKLESEAILHEFVDGIKDPVTFRGCSNAHKSVVRAAQERGDEMVAIAEDDIQLIAGGFEYFLDNIPEEFDIYLGACSNGYPAEDGFVHDFRGLFCYIVHSRFYNRFLSVNELSHIDTALSELTDTKYKLIDKFICIHSDGYSDQNHGYKTYGHLWEGRKFYNNDKS